MTNYLTLLQTLEDYYANLLIIQYNGKPKAAATIKLYVDLLLMNVLLLQIRDAFNLEDATGAQQDIIGKWVGIDRFYEGQLFDFHPWFSLIDWNDPNPDSLQGGFSTFETFDTISGGFLDYQNINPTQNKLPDEQFQQLIGLKIIKNSIDHTCKAIDEAIWNFFNGQVYTVWDLENRTLIYYYQSEYNNLLEVAMRKNLLPCPPTVKIQLEEITSNGSEQNTTSNG